ncbi:MAG: Ppx/GppA phosphatase family protein [Anaerolineae bacterium]
MNEVTLAKWAYAPPSMERVGIIDLGSNTTRLVIYGYAPGRAFRIEDAVREQVRLSEGMDEGNVLRAEPMRRAIEALRLFKRFSEVNGVTDILCVATAASRDAVNGPAFLRRLESETGLTPRLLSGEEEAYYGYVAAVNSLQFTDGLVVDIGGGSAEMTQVAQRQLVQARSLPLGSVRTSERFLKSDPPRKGEVSALVDHVNAQIQDFDWLGGPMMVGMGGTIRALAKIDRAIRQPGVNHLHGFTLTKAAVDRLVDQLRGQTIAQRMNIPGLSKDRADVLLGGAIVLQQIMTAGRHASLTVSNHGIREGLFYERFLKAGGDGALNGGPPLLDNVREFGIQNLLSLYGGNLTHFAHTRRLALSLFDQLQPAHGYGAFERDILSAAAWLHDVGMVIDYWDHQMHSQYIILNSPMLGWSHREVALIALLARNHRRGGVTFEGLAGALEAGDDTRVERLAALLRLAEFLERGKTGVVADVRVHSGEDWVQIEALARGDASIEVWEASRNSDLFRKAYGRSVEIVASVAASEV